MPIQNTITSTTRTDRVAVQGDDLVFDVRGHGAPIVLLP
jgi:hypothetical protein